MTGDRGAPDGPAPFLSVIVPVRNGERTIGACLRAILDSRYPPGSREIIVVDNASTDRTAEIIRRCPVHRLWEPQRGASHARNRGIAQSRADILVFTDADCEATPAWLPSLVAAFTDPEVSAAAGEVVAYPPRTAAERYAARRRPRWQQAALSAPRPYFVTANVALRRGVFERIGLFDPRFLVGQDQELSRRFFAAGLRVRYSPEALVFHHHRDTVWRLFTQQLGWGYGARQLDNYAPRLESKELLRCLWRCVQVTLGPGRRSPAGGDVSFAYLELLRGVARTLGAIHCTARRTASPWGRSGRPAPIAREDGGAGGGEP